MERLPLSMNIEANDSTTIAHAVSAVRAIDTHDTMTASWKTISCHRMIKLHSNVAIQTTCSCVIWPRHKPVAPVQSGKLVGVHILTIFSSEKNGNRNNRFQSQTVDALKP